MLGGLINVPHLLTIIPPNIFYVSFVPAQNAPPLFSYDGVIIKVNVSVGL